MVDGVIQRVRVGVENVIGPLRGQFDPWVDHEAAGADAQRLEILRVRNNRLLPEAGVVIGLGQHSGWCIHQHNRRRQIQSMTECGPGLTHALISLVIFYPQQSANYTGKEPLRIKQQLLYGLIN